ncbi:MAG: cytochrome c-type biogenesis protein CcmH, partial [Anaerolineae bacterium]|nr:cytochrome c-type biogenesis protein CcmH [Anaerolineae bacterium]
GFSTEDGRDISRPYRRRGKTRQASSLLALFLAFLLIAAPVAAQIEITADEVNNVAKQLYCPVCPNETLDVCQTQACAQWRDEIRTQLSEGQNAQQVIDSFARRYGERVLATPQDPTLRALSLYTPFLLAGIALVIGAIPFLRWTTRKPQPLRATPPLPSERGSGGEVEDDAYRSLIERDLRD